MVPGLTTARQVLYAATANVKSSHALLLDVPPPKQRRAVRKIVVSNPVERAIRRKRGAIDPQSQAKIPDRVRKQAPRTIPALAALSQMTDLSAAASHGAKTMVNAIGRKFSAPQ